MLKKFDINLYLSRYTISKTGVVYDNKRKRVLNKRLQNGKESVRVYYFKRNKDTRPTRVVRIIAVDKLVLATYGGNPKNATDLVKHRDGDVTNNNFENLMWMKRKVPFTSNQLELF